MKKMLILFVSLFSFNLMAEAKLVPFMEYYSDAIANAPMFENAYESPNLAAIRMLLSYYNGNNYNWAKLQQFLDIKVAPAVKGLGCSTIYDGLHYNPAKSICICLVVDSEEKNLDENHYFVDTENERFCDKMIAASENEKLVDVMLYEFHGRFKIWDIVDAENRPVY